MGKKQKILFVLPRMNGGGAERVASILVNHLCHTYDVTLVVLVSDTSFYPLEKEVRFISGMLEVDRTSKAARMASMARNFLRAIAFVRRQIREQKPVIVFSMLPQTDIVTALAMTGMRGVCHISSERGDPGRRNRMMQFILEQIYRRCQRFVCQSEAVARYYDKIPQENKAVIPNPVDFENYPPRVPEGTPIRVVGIGRLRPVKNFALLIDSFSIIADRHPKVRLDIYGEGSQRQELQAKINAYNLQERITLRGASRQVLMDIRDAAVFVMPSNNEGFPNALVEAIAMGIPAISTDFATGVAREIVGQETGIVVPCGDRQAMAKALDELLSDTARREEMRQKGYHAVEPFACDRVIDTWDHLFRELIEENR